MGKQCRLRLVLKEWSNQDLHCMPGCFRFAYSILPIPILPIPLLPTTVSRTLKFPSIPISPPGMFLCQLYKLQRTSTQVPIN